MAIYFFSDVHIGASEVVDEQDKIDRLFSLLKLIKDDGEKLYILGDLFDFWFEYKHVVPAQYHRVLHQLAGLIQGGTKIIYVAGNHDFWLGDFFVREVGMEISREPVVAEHQGLKLHIAHGDGLAQKDRGYQLLKKILRHPLNIWLYRQIHPDIGIPLAKLASASSRAYTDQKALEMVVEYEQAAHKILSDGFDAVILGHSHYPILHHFGDKTYLNIGDWITHFTYGMLDRGTLTLKRWDGSLNESPPICPS